jgi:hypothetical protein
MEENKEGETRDERASFEMGEDPWVCTGRLSLRRRNARAFYDPEHRDLVFMIPKRWVRNGWILDDEGPISAIVYMARGDPTLAMDIDSGCVFSLRPRGRWRKGGWQGQSFKVDALILHHTARRAEVLLDVDART